MTETTRDEALISISKDLTDQYAENDRLRRIVDRMGGEGAVVDRLPEDVAPENHRVLIFGTMPEGHAEAGMAWKDRIDRLWYFAPQGGLVPFKVEAWCHVPGEEADE